MSVKIYDSAIGAFRDAETPMIWDEQKQAYKDSTGLVWNESAQAWEERWGGSVYLYKDGNECESVTGGWDRMNYNWSSGATGGAYVVTKNSDCIQIQNRGYSAGAMAFNTIYVCNQNNIDFSSFSRIVLKCRDYEGKTSGSPHCYLDYFKRNSLDTISHLGIYQYVGTTSEFTIQSEIPNDMKTGNCRICIEAYYASFKVEKLWLEK